MRRPNATARGGRAAHETDPNVAKEKIRKIIEEFRAGLDEKQKQGGRVLG